MGEGRILNLRMQDEVLRNPLLLLPAQVSYCLAPSFGPSSTPHPARSCPKLQDAANEHAGFRGLGDLEALERGLSSILSDEIRLDNGELDLPIPP